jgi:hypothetical protein
MLRTFLATLLIAVVLPAAATKKPDVPDADFMLVLRESEGANKRDFGYAPVPPSRLTLADGEEVTLENAWFEVIGDMHVRFVADGEHMMRNLSAEEFAVYRLTPEQAVEVAVRNIRSRYGAPRATPWEAGIMQVAGKSPDLDSSYFLDHAFWTGVLSRHPEGVIVGVPARGGLVYAPVADAAAVKALEARIRPLHTRSGRMRVSSRLYLYRDGRWSVHAPTP